MSLLNKYSCIKIPEDGFSILESVIAISILTVGIVSVLNLTRQSIKVNYINKNTIVAAQLAQEGVELVRKRRDENWLNRTDWEANITNNVASPNSNIFAIDYTMGHASTTKGVTGISDPNSVLKIDGSGFFQYNSGSLSSFSRIITISDIDPNNNYFLVTCQVRFKKDNNTYDYTASSYLYNWLR